MQIDWITTLAQAVNFLVLLWLLQRFLYRPISNAIERRREGIQERLDEAATRREEADEAARSFEEKQRELEAERQAKLDEARQEAEQLKHDLTEEAKQEIAAKRESWREEFRADREALMDEFRRKLADFILDATRSALTALADSDIEAVAAKRFGEELKAIDEADLKALQSVLREEGGAVVIESAMALDPSAKRNLTRLVHDKFGDEVDVEYQTDEDLLLGLRLRAGARSVEWSLAGLLDDLDDVFEDLASSGEPASEPSEQEAA